MFQLVSIEQQTTLYSKRMQKAYLSFGERKWMEMGEPVLQCGSMYSIYGTFYVTFDSSQEKKLKITEFTRDEEHLEWV